MRFLDTSGGWCTFAGSFGSELFSGSFSSGGFTSGLLGSGHRDEFVFLNEF
jgi:hypothetical protein